MTKNKTPRTFAFAFLTLCALLLQTIGGFGACVLPTPAQQPFTPPIKEVIVPNPNTSYGLVTLSNVPAGYTVTNGIYLGWCLDSFQQIGVGVPYCPVLYDSYDTASLTTAGIPTANLDKVNYILNHKPVGQATEVQLAIWHFIGGGGSSETDLETGNGPFPLPIQAVLDAIIADADANGAGFVPGPGQVTGVVLDLAVSLNGLDPDTGLPFQRFLIEVTCPPGSCVCPAIPDPLYATTSGEHALWLPGIGTDFVFVPSAGTFVQNPDGTARITGMIASKSNPLNSFEVDLQLSGLTSTPPPGSPKKELNASAYVENGGPVDPATWNYYPGFSGTLLGTGNNAGAVLNLVRVGPAFQIGLGANGKNINMGASNWFNWTVAMQPTVGQALQTTGQGDVNIDLCECPSNLCILAAFNDPAVNTLASNHSLWLPGIGTDFEFSPYPGSFIQNEDGTASISGLIRSLSNPGNSFHVELQLTGRTITPPPDSPKKELAPSAYIENGGPIDPSTWSYYTGFSGTLFGVSNYAGAKLTLVQVGPAFQIGVGASGKNLHFGASNWFNWTVVSQPVSGPYLPTTGQGDVNIDIFDCPTRTGSIGDFVWKDLNGNGAQDADEPGIDGIRVTLKNGSDLTVAVASTGPHPSIAGQGGYYQFGNLLAGTYKVIVDNSSAALANCVPTTANASGVTTDKDSNLNPATVMLMTDSSSDQTVDFGFVNAPPGFQITKSANKTIVNPGESVTYTYTVVNTGGTTLTNIVVTDDNATPNFAGDDFIVGEIASLGAGLQQTFTLTKYPPVKMCTLINNHYTECGTMSVHKLANGDYLCFYRQHLGLVDNTYGTGSASDWPATHYFSDLTGGDKCQFRFTNAAGTTVLDCFIDYLSSSSSFPSGYGCLGTSGDGTVTTGSASSIASCSSTLSGNLNQSSAFYSYKTNSPNPPANFPTWDYECGYKVVIKGSTFGSSGYGGVSVPMCYNSPAKKGGHTCRPVPCDYNATNTAKGTAMSGSVTLMSQASATVRVKGTALGAAPYTTYKHENGWGLESTAAGLLLKNNFSTLYPSGLTVGGNRTIKFTNIQAIYTLLPASGAPNKLSTSATNPTSTNAGELASQIVALKLNVDFSNAGIIRTGLGSLKLKSGKFIGKTVTQMLTTANSVLGGGSLPSGTTYADVNTAVKTINENYADGTTNKGNLIP